MITLQAITGLLIAAVLNVPGTSQREVAQVEEKPVVKEEVIQAIEVTQGQVNPVAISEFAVAKSIIADGKKPLSREEMVWFEVNPDDPTELGDYISSSAICPDPPGTLCAIGFRPEDAPNQTPPTTDVADALANYSVDQAYKQ